MQAILKLATVLTLVTNAAPGPHSRADHTCSLIQPGSASCVHNDQHLTCTGGFTAEWLRGCQNHITNLTLYHWPGDCFNVGRLQQHFPSLLHFELRNCSELRFFKGHFDDECKIQTLVISGMPILWELPGEVVAGMPHLRVLDLRGNMLRHMKAKTLRPPLLQRVYMKDNKWDCSDDGFDWLAMEKTNSSIRRLIIDYYELTCNQQLYRGKPLHKVMDIIKNVRLTCPVECQCTMTNVVTDRSGGIIPLITVDCASRDLTLPPPALPPSTSTLRLEGNKINTIHTILQNFHYQDLVDLYLDNNSIPSVKELEASEWFTKFRVLSLRGNLLKQIPVYAFDKAFQSNNNIMHVFLGQNPWRCDCHFTPRFQALLLKYKRVIRDLKDIRCSNSSNIETSLVQISTMSLASVCSASTGMPLSPVNIANIVLATLLLLVIGRFVYDWHSFKTTGKLPWLSSILP